MDQQLNATVVSKISTRTGQPYWAIEIEFVGTSYKKLVFLTDAEKALLGV